MYAERAHPARESSTKVPSDKLLDIKAIEGRLSPHDAYLREQMARRKVCLGLAKDPSQMASYIGGILEARRADEKWCIAKEFFPGVRVHILFRADEEFGTRAEAFFSGDAVLGTPGEELAEMAVLAVNRMIRYIRSSTPEEMLPEVCKRI